MTIHSTFRTLFTVALLGGFTGLAGAGSEDNDSLAPTVTAAEAGLAFRDVPYLDTAFIDTAPAGEPAGGPAGGQDAIPVGELGRDGGNRDMIVTLAQEIAEGRHGSFDSLLIAHKGKLVFESYYARGRADLPHPQASTTKAYTALAIGRAIQLGYLTMADLERPVASFLHELDPARFARGTDAVTLDKAMTMRSGLRISREKMAELRENPGALRGQAQVQAYFEHSAPVTAESQSFLYQGVDTQLVMHVLDAVVPGTAEDFIKTELLDKMGITNYGWREDISGLPRGPSGSSMTSRNMLKWGTLAMNKGKWNGEQLVPEAYIAKATNSIVRMGEDDIFFTGNNVSNPGYGYFWWQANMNAGGKSYFTTSAQGGGGQYIILIEELDLIVVTTGHDREERMMQVTADRVLPAFVR